MAAVAIVGTVESVPESRTSAMAHALLATAEPLDRHLAACDLAVVQGGLTTTMELTAAGRPFLYVPIRHHFEQNLHVPHRLDRNLADRPAWCRFSTRCMVTTAGPLPARPSGSGGGVEAAMDPSVRGLCANARNYSVCART